MMQQPQAAPFLVQQDATSECAESWEVCSNVSSVASSWAMLEGEQHQHGLALKTEEDDVEEADANPDASSRDEEELVVPSPSGRPALTFAQALLRRTPLAVAPLQQRQQLSSAGSLDDDDDDDDAAEVTKASPGKSTTPVLDEASTKEAAPLGMAALPETEKENEAKEEQEREKDLVEKRKAVKHALAKTVKNEEEVWAGRSVEDEERGGGGAWWSMPDAVPGSKDKRGGRRWTKGAKGPRSVVQRENVATSRAQQQNSSPSMRRGRGGASCVRESL